MKRHLGIAIVAITVDYASVSHATGGLDLASAQCTIKGRAKLAVPVYSAPNGGVQLLSVSGHERNVLASDLPPDTASGRIHVRASRDVPGLRIDGYVASKTFTFSAAKDQAVVANHVWLRAGASLRLYQSLTALDGDAFGSPIANTRTRVDCADLRFGETSAAPTPKGEKMLLHAKATPLLDGPAGKQVFLIDAHGGHDLIVYASKTQGVFRKIDFAEDVKFVGWVRAADLDTFGAGPLYGIGGLGGSGDYANKVQTTYTAKYDTEVYLSAGTSGPVAAVLEQGAVVYQHPISNGYSTITLYDHDASPPDGKDFHVLTSALQ